MGAKQLPRLIFEFSPQYNGSMKRNLFHQNELTPPPLTDELMYQFIFCMEDQANDYLFDLVEGVPVQRELAGGTPEERLRRYRELPSWKPADGFRVMEKFVSSLKNPIFRERLREALAQGKGVFRSFKNILREEPAVERLWFYFKEREIKRAVYIWYEQMTEVSYLERLGEPEQDTSELILSDFTISQDSGRWREQIREIGSHRLASEFAVLEYPLNELLLNEYTSRWDAFEDDWQMVFVETPAGDFAGFIGAEPLTPDGESLLFCVKLLYVEPLYRGLGIFKLLIDTLCQRVSDSGADRLVIELSGKSSVTIPTLEHRGFIPFSERFSLDLTAWRKKQQAWSDS